MDAICVIALFNVLFLVFQYFTVDPLWKPIGGGKSHASLHSVGLMSDRNNASALLAFCFPAFLRTESKTIYHIGRFSFPIYWWPYLAIFPIWGLIRTTSCGGAVAVFVGILCYAMFLPRALHYKAVVMGVAVLAILSYFKFVNDPNISTSSHRFVTAKQGLELCKEKPLFGAGLGQWKVIFLGIFKQNPKKYAGKWMSHAHNEYIQTLYELGIGFAVILSGYLVSIVRRITRQVAVPVTALVVILVNSLVNFPFHIATTAVVAITWMAILDIELARNKICQK